MDHVVSRHARLAQIKEEACYLRGTAARTVLQYGILMREVERDELWREDGKKSFTAWLAAFQPGKVSTIRAGMRVAEHYSLDQAGEHGIEKLDEALRLRAASPKMESAADILTSSIRIRGPKGTFVLVPFALATIPQVRGARLLVVESAKPKPKADDGLAALQRDVGTLAKVSRDEHGGFLVLPKRALSLTQLQALAAVVQRHAARAR
jgi:hypothetical protein